LPDAFPKPQRYLQGYSARTLGGGGPGAPPPVGPGRDLPGGAAPSGQDWRGLSPKCLCPARCKGRRARGRGRARDHRRRAARAGPRWPP
jgi:hypothetical protein